jgi:hypothetical protein
LGAGTSGFGQVPAFGQDQDQPASPKSGDEKSRRSGRSTDDPFQPSPNFGDASGSQSSVAGFTGAGGFGTGRQSSASFNPFGGSAMGGRQGGLAPLFPASDGPTRSQFGAAGPFGAAPGGMPSLNQLMHGTFNMPLSSSSSAFRFSYQDALRPGGNLGDLGRPSASAMFTTSDLGNGVFFSAGTGYGSRSMAGEPPSTFGSGTGSGPKHSSPALNLKLSF